MQKIGLKISILAFSDLSLYHFLNIIFLIISLFYSALLLKTSLTFEVFQLERHKGSLLLISVLKRDFLAFNLL